MLDLDFLPNEILYEIFSFIEDVILLFKSLVISKSIHYLVIDLLKKKWSINTKPLMKKMKFIVVNKSGFWDYESRVSQNLEITIMCDSKVKLKQLIPFFVHLTWNTLQGLSVALLNCLCFCCEPHPFHSSDMGITMMNYDLETSLCDIHNNQLYINHVDRLLLTDCDVVNNISKGEWIINTYGDILNLKKTVFIKKFETSQSFYCISNDG